MTLTTTMMMAMTMIQREKGLLKKMFRTLNTTEVRPQYCQNGKKPYLNTTSFGQDFSQYCQKLLSENKKNGVERTGLNLSQLDPELRQFRISRCHVVLAKI
jgi:hypothetical protein